MIPLKLQATITQAYEDANLDIPTHHQGFEFTPPDDNSGYARCVLLPGASDQRSQTVDKLTVLLHIDLIFPQSEGSNAIKTVGDQLCAYFEPSRLFILNGQAATVVSRVATAVKDIDDGKQRTTITVTFRAVVPRIAAA